MAKEAGCLISFDPNLRPPLWNTLELSLIHILGASFFKGTYTVDYGGIVASSVMIIIPELIFYGFFQKNIVEGMTAGAVKGENKKGEKRYEQSIRTVSYTHL